MIEGKIMKVIKVKIKTMINMVWYEVHLDIMMLETCRLECSSGYIHCEMPNLVKGLFEGGDEGFYTSVEEIMMWLKIRDVGVIQNLLKHVWTGIRTTVKEEWEGNFIKNYLLLCNCRRVLVEQPGDCEF
jgi:hypothetical protein